MAPVAKTGNKTRRKQTPISARHEEQDSASYIILKHRGRSFESKLVLVVFVQEGLTNGVQREVKVKTNRRNFDVTSL